MWNFHGIGEENLFKWSRRGSRSFVVLHYCQPQGGRGCAAGAFSRDFTINLAPQCRAFSRALKTEKLKAPLFPGPVGTGTTNDWCIKLLEYKSIDIEARSRCNNLLFRGFPESRDEKCTRVILKFLEEKMGVDEPPVIERAHRLGRFNRFKGPGPIIDAFTFYRDTEDIISLAGSLKGTHRSINRDYPREITNTRRTLWPQFKSARANPANRVSIGYPAKLIVNGTVVRDLFPDWNHILNGSRISNDQSHQSDQ